MRYEIEEAGVSYSMPATVSLESIGALREDTPGCLSVTHLNNAGAALMPKPVLDVMTGYLQKEALMGGYEAAREEHNAIESVYQSIASLIGAQVDEIALAQSATRAWQQIFYALNFKPGDRILTCMSEYASNYIAYLQMAQKTGVHIEVIPNDDHGQLDIQALTQLVDERVKLIAITHIPTNGGLINPAEAVGVIARKANIPYLLDACQSVGQLPINVQSIGCDFLSATSRKYLRGPRGAGFLYVSQSKLATLEPPMLDLFSAVLHRKNGQLTYEMRADARRFESWEASYMTNLGLGAAVDYAMALGMDAIYARIQLLATYLRQSLRDIPGITLQDLGQHQSGLVSFTVANKIPADVCAYLAAQHINTSYSSLEYTYLDMESRQLKQLVRASVHYYNTEADIDKLCAALRRF